MINAEILYTTAEKQIEKLKSQNLLIENEKIATEYLSMFGYSNLVKSYREPFVITKNGKKVYRSGITFEQLLSLYMLDKNLRNGVMAAMQDLEEHIKEITSDVIAKPFGTHQEQYLQYRNYRNKRKRIERFSLAGILNTMRKTLNTDKDPIYHYKTVHGIVPPWILFKSIYFSTTINFIDQLKDNEQTFLIQRLYGESTGLTESSLKMLMMDTLFICLDYRNKAAHGGRIYNYDCSDKLRANEIFGEENNPHITGFSQLLFLLDLLDYSNPFLRLNEILNVEVNRHCQKYPQDATYLGQILSVDIIPQKIVYISSASNKYHINPHCSGIENAFKMELEDAKGQGFVPCKRCIKHST